MRVGKEKPVKFIFTYVYMVNNGSFGFGNTEITLPANTEMTLEFYREIEFQILQKFKKEESISVYKVIGLNSIVPLS